MPISRRSFAIRAPVALSIGLPALFASGAGRALAQQAPPALPQSVAELVRVRDDVYAFRYLNHVALFIPTDEGVILVDPIGGGGNRQAPAVLKEAIRSVSERPVSYLLYSHWGADHGIGGIVFRDTATLVSHRNAAPKIVAANDPTSPPPDLTFDDFLSVEQGGKTLELHYAARSAEDDYFLAWYPAQKVLMTVDLVRVRTLPFGELQGAPGVMVDFIDRVLNTFDFEVFLSGHGPSANVLGTRGDMVDHRQYYLDLVDAIRAARAAGLEDDSEGMIEAVRAALAPQYATWVNFPNGLAGNIRGAIRFGV